MYCGFMRSISLNFNVWIGFIPTPVPDMPLLFKSKKNKCNCQFSGVLTYSTQFSKESSESSMNLQLRPKSVLQAKFGDAMDLDVVGKVHERSEDHAPHYICIASTDPNTGVATVLHSALPISNLRARAVIKHRHVDQEAESSRAPRGVVQAGTPNRRSQGRSRQ